ncbi:hypothetical protein [Nocardioides sp. AX2bis]|uniref:hypothetical protein n=1 Tax=Nocardioides sp. AX2bis TaxID=2653157 RepID=UPI0012F00783|nr:hypothetical protein [Nocardioides sp. AX2bis]VXB29937.1 conserved membrane hypothetical protein [Nocardioides sp. AX2bis]
MGPDRARTGTSGTTWRRTTAAYALVVLAPAVAWLAFVSWADGKPSDHAHVAWFAGVAAACVVAGAVARPRTGHVVGLCTVAVVSTVLTLFAWWSAEDETGLFMVGIVMATPCVAVTAPALLLAGRLVTTGQRTDS